MTRVTRDRDDDVILMGVEPPAPAKLPTADDADNLPTLENSDVLREESMDDDDDATDDVKPQMQGTAFASDISDILLCRKDI